MTIIIIMLVVFVVLGVSALITFFTMSFSLFRAAGILWYHMLKTAASCRTRIGGSNMPSLILQGVMNAPPKGKTRLRVFPFLPKGNRTGWK